LGEKEEEEMRVGTKVGHFAGLLPENMWAVASIDKHVLFSSFRAHRGGSG
jgi:hypothetical protein